jgi:two-component system, response regulator, stage 0 sporulation protein F
MPAAIEAFTSHGAVLASDRIRVLLAEDDAELRTLLASELAAVGCEVEEIADGRQFMDWLAQWSDPARRDDSCHIVISDIRMPGHSGLDILARLHRLSSGPPVIMITAFGDPATRRLAASLGAVAVFDKPFDVDDLRTAVLHFAANSLARRPAAPAPTIPWGSRSRVASR